MKVLRKAKRRCCGVKGEHLKKVSQVSSLFRCSKCGREYHALT